MTWINDLFGPYLVYTIIGIVILIGGLTWFVISNIKKPKQRDQNNPLPDGDMIVDGSFKEGTQANALAKLTNQLIKTSQETIRDARRNARKRPGEIIKECEETIANLEDSKSQILRWQEETQDIIKAIEVSIDETEDLKENTYRANPWLRPKPVQDHAP